MKSSSIEITLTYIPILTIIIDLCSLQHKKGLPLNKRKSQGTPFGYNTLRNSLVGDG